MDKSTLDKANKIHNSIFDLSHKLVEYRKILASTKKSEREIMLPEDVLKLLSNFSVFEQQIHEKELAVKIITDIILFYENKLNSLKSEFEKL